MNIFAELYPTSAPIGGGRGHASPPPPPPPPHPPPPHSPPPPHPTPKPPAHPPPPSAPPPPHTHFSERWGGGSIGTVPPTLGSAIVRLSHSQTTKRRADRGQCERRQRPREGALLRVGIIYIYRQQCDDNGGADFNKQWRMPLNCGRCLWVTSLWVTTTAMPSRLKQTGSLNVSAIARRFLIASPTSPATPS